MSSLHGITRRAAVLAALALPLAPALAEAPPQRTQVPGYYRLAVGSAEVTALYDGVVDLDRAMLKDASPAEVQRLLARMFAATPRLQTAVNTFLVNTGGKLVLVDTGAGRLSRTGDFLARLGNVVANLRASGHEPSQVDVVLVTHMHPDHVGGLVDAEGKFVFPNAEVRVAEVDAAFWLSEEEAAKAPEDAKPRFGLAQQTARALTAAGKWRTFSWGDEVAPGFRAVQANGHTAGHTAFELTSNGQRLLLWGDTVINAAVQFARPSVTYALDADRKQAAATRRRLFREAAGSEELVAGAHLPFPGLGHVRAEGGGSFAWVPVEYGPIR